MNARKPTFLFVFLWLIWFSSCGQSVKFAGGNASPLVGSGDAIPGEPAPEPTAPLDPDPDPIAIEPDPDPDPEPEELEEKEPKTCPKENQKILVVDFKSGWWAGDGGTFFQKLLNGLTAECLGKVEFEYHHILRSCVNNLTCVRNEMIVVPGASNQLTRVSNDFENGAFTETDWNNYQQIWFLSGAHADPADIRTNAPFFQELLRRASESNANLFIGAGFGSITHANAFGGSLGLPQLFATTLTEGLILDPMQGVSVTTELEREVHFMDHPLFARGVSSIADHMRIATRDAKGDYIALMDQRLDILAHDTDSLAAIGVFTLDSDRKLVLDAGLQRYYAIWRDLSVGTHTLIQNIIVYLSQYEKSTPQP